MGQQASTDEKNFRGREVLRQGKWEALLYALVPSIDHDRKYGRGLRGGFHPSHTCDIKRPVYRLYLQRLRFIGTARFVFCSGWNYETIPLPPLWALHHLGIHWNKIDPQ